MSVDLGVKLLMFGLLALLGYLVNQLNERVYRLEKEALKRRYPPQGDGRG